MLNPHIKDPSRMRTNQKIPPYRFKRTSSPEEKIARKVSKNPVLVASDAEIHRAIAQGFEIDSSDWEIRDKYLSKDRRGRAVPEIQQEVWGYLSRRTVAWKCVAYGYGKASLVLRLRPGQTVSEYVKNELAAGSGSEKLFEILYAWRCTCPRRTHVTYETVDDLPQEVGYHDACISCGSAPLEVIVDE
jgi:hypothetical protein